MIEILQKHEELLRFDDFTNDDALCIGQAIVQYARNRGKVVAIEIVLNGWTVFLFAMNGTSPEHNRWLRRKRNFLEYRRTSSLLGQKIMESQEQTWRDLVLDEANYSEKGGAFPIIIGNQFVGSITVCGLTETEDHQMVADVLASYLQREIPSILE